MDCSASPIHINSRRNGFVIYCRGSRALGASPKPPSISRAEVALLLS